MITRSSFSRRKVGRRPRGSRPVGPSSTQCSSTSSSTMSEMVLRCMPDARAKSAREMGWRVRIKLRTILRLMSRTTSLDAVCIPFNSITVISFASHTKYSYKRTISPEVESYSTACCMMIGVRYALRVLSKDLGFTTIATLTLALGIGVNTAIFTVVNALLLRPLPYENSDRLMMLYGSNPKRAVGRGSFSLGRLEQLRSASQSFTDVAGYCSESFNLTGSDEPEQLPAARVSSNFLRTLGVRPILGRDFLPQEDKVGGQPVVLLGYSLWQRRFGAKPDVVGTAVTLDSTRYTIIGVLPAGLDQPAARLDLLATHLSAFSRFTPEKIGVAGGYIYASAGLKHRF